MTYVDAATAQVRESYFTVQVNGGSALTGMLSYEAATSRSQRNSTCTLTCRAMPEIAPADDVLVTQYLRVPGGTWQTAVAFRGDFYDGGWSYDGGKTVELQCRGLLNRLSNPYGGLDRVYGYVLTDAERSAAAVKRNLIEAMGIDALRHSIPEPVLLDEDDVPGLWLLGEFQLIWTGTNTPLMPLIEKIDTVIGWATYDDLDGVIRSTEAAPSGAEATVPAGRTFVQGTTGVRISRKRTSSHGVINQHVVKGREVYDVPVEAEISDPSTVLNNFYPPELHPAHAGQEFQSDLIETPNHAFRVAEHRLSYTNRLADEHTLELEVARLDLRLGDTIGLVYAGTDIWSGARVLIESQRATGDNRTGKTGMTITTNGGTLV